MDMTWFDEVEARIPKGKVRTRFAPSPTGYMHVGNLRTALYTWLIARHADGTFILRIEDTDQGRLVEGAVDVIYKTLAECGLDHDEGPDVGGPVAPYIQTERRPFYGRYAELLIERGHAYRCFCEKSESEEDSGEFDRGDDPCRALPREEAERRAAAGEPFVIRQRIPHEGTTTFHDEIFGDITVENSTLDDQVLMKRDGLPTYNFANVVDDHMMGITHVVRGSEYLSSAPKYNLLYQGFGWDIPRYIHCPPVMKDEHNKLKQHNEIGRVISERGFDFINFDHAVDKIGLDLENDFYSDSHLNAHGQIKLTRYFSGILSKQYIVGKSDLSNENSDRWNKSYEYTKLFYEYYKLHENDSVITVWYETPQLIKELEALKQRQ